MRVGVYLNSAGPSLNSCFPPSTSAPAVTVLYTSRQSTDGDGLSPTESLDILGMIAGVYVERVLRAPNCRVSDDQSTGVL
jgi:hypothetical protein